MNVFTCSGICGRKLIIAHVWTNCVRTPDATASACTFSWKPHKAATHKRTPNAYSSRLHDRLRLPAPVPMTLALSRHRKHNAELLTSQAITFDPPTEAKPYTDLYGNLCHQILAPQGLFTMLADFEILVSDDHDIVEPTAGQFPVDRLPPETLIFLLGSRFCETDRLSNVAWSLFGGKKPGWERVQATATSCTIGVSSATRMPGPTRPPSTPTTR